MDKTTAKLVSYTNSSSYESLTSSAIHATKRILLDTLGCAIGAYHSKPSQIACKLAMRSSSSPGARVWGSGLTSSVEAAAFANGVMVRYLDFNDTYMSKEASHPSDMIPAILAVGEACGISGKQALLAIATAFEVEMTFADTCNLFNKGFDHGFYIGLGTVVGIAQILKLNNEQVANAIALTCTPNIPTRQTRSGALTMWKGCAASASARAAIFAADLAKEGMTGPSEPFEGRHGIWDQVTGPFELPPFGGGNLPFAIERSAIKYLPTEYNSQLPLYLMLKLAKQVSAESVESIHVEVYHFTFTEIGSEPEKWRPTTRETADHSLPYMLAVALIDGSISVDSFSEERILDPQLPPFMDRIKITENLEFTQRYPISMECRIEIKTKSGASFIESGSYPKGHEKNPMTDEEVQQKFLKLCADQISKNQADSIIDAVWNIEKMDDISELLTLICIDNKQK